MAVADITPIGGQTADGVTTSFSFAYPVMDASDLVVLAEDVLQTIEVDYTLTGVGSPSGGTIDFLIAPEDGVRIAHYRDSPDERSTNYASELRAAVVNADFDAIWLKVLEITSGAVAPANTVRGPIGETVPAMEAAADRATHMLAFDADGDPQATTFTEAQVEAVITQAALLGLDLEPLHRIVVTDEGVLTGDSEALVDSQGISTTWAYNIRRRDTGHDSRVGSDGAGWTFEHPIRTAFLGRNFTLDDAESNVITAAYQGGVIRCGTTEAGANILDYIANASLNGIVTSFFVEAIDYAVEFAPSAGGDTINGATDPLVMSPGQSAIFYATEDGWIVRKLGGTAVLTTILTADIGSVVAVPGRDLYYVSDYSGGTYWAPNAAGVLFRLGASNGQQATEITASQLRAITPGDAEIYKVIDWPASRGSYWAEYNGDLLPLLGAVVAYKTSDQVAVASSLTEQVTAVFEVPAGVLIAGMGIIVKWGQVKSGLTDVLQWRVRLGSDSAGDAPNAELITTSALTTAGLGFELEFVVISNTEIRRQYGPGLPNWYANSSATTAPASVTVDDLSASALYFSITATFASIANAETAVMNGARVEFVL